MNQRKMFIGLTLSLMLAAVCGRTQPFQGPPPDREENMGQSQQSSPMSNMGQSRDPGRAWPAKRAPRDIEANMEQRMDRIWKKLDLTPDQEKQLKEHRKAHRKEALDLHETLKEKREILREELEKPKLDEGKVKTAHNQMKEAQDKLADHRLEGILVVRRILTPEQFKKFQELAPQGRQGSQKWDKEKGKGRKGEGFQKRDREGGHRWEE